MLRQERSALQRLRLFKLAAGKAVFLLTAVIHKDRMMQLCATGSDLGSADRFILQAARAAKFSRLLMPLTQHPSLHVGNDAQSGIRNFLQERGGLLQVSIPS